MNPKSLSQVTHLQCFWKNDLLNKKNNSFPWGTKKGLTHPYIFRIFFIGFGGYNPFFALSNGYS